MLPMSIEITSGIFNLISRSVTCVLDTLKKLVWVAFEVSQTCLVFAVHVLSKTIQGTVTSDESGFDFDQSWICVM